MGVSTGGIVLCGGKSRRMGQPKATLPFGSELMLQRVVRLVGQAVGPIVVVAAEGQQLPPLPKEVRIARDRHPDRGPLEGLTAGLRALPDDVDAAFVSACDLPLLKPHFIRRLLDLVPGFDVAVPHVGGFDEPLCAVYRKSVLPEIETLLAENRRRPVFLFERVRTRRVTAEELADMDPELQSLQNTNTPEAYRAALERMRA
ncbi:MAG: molybdenum cofactor guanylyltransferase [Pirellulales bacterium]|nr:molybdenum cofactor guanylyltransferase [Pirellulales bacterium]